MMMMMMMIIIIIIIIINKYINKILLPWNMNGMSIK